MPARLQCRDILQRAAVRMCVDVRVDARVDLCVDTRVGVRVDTCGNAVQMSGSRVCSRDSWRFLATVRQWPDADIPRRARSRSKAPSVTAVGSGRARRG